MSDWLEMQVTVPAAAVDLFSANLLELGCAGVTVAERALDTFEQIGRASCRERV